LSEIVPKFYGHIGNAALIVAISLP
jgi:hypothetical protein